MLLFSADVEASGQFTDARAITATGQRKRKCENFAKARNQAQRLEQKWYVKKIQAVTIR